MAARALAQESQAFHHRVREDQQKADLDRCLRPPAEANPNEATAYYYLGITYEKTGDMEQAKESYTVTINMVEEYVSANPDSIDGHFMLGFCYEGIDDMEKAKEGYLKVLDLNPEHQEAKAGLERVEQYLP